MKIVPLFPIALAAVKFDRDLNINELNLVYESQKTARKNVGNFTGVDDQILNRSEFSDLKKFIDFNVKKYFNEIICPEGEVEPYICLSWLNFTEKGEYHHKHRHGNSILSGVFYINADVEKDKIYFYNEVYRTIELDPATYNIYNSPSWWYPVGTNDLILFPSYLEHSVALLENEETRISIAFNVFVKGQIGNKKSLKRLNL